MAVRIYKYQVYVGASVTIRGVSKVLMFGAQGASGLFVWAEITDGGPVVVLDVLPTGAEVPPDYKHRASCQEGPYVWHLYERASR